jgi:uncharacterized protein with HEPN domain
MLRDLRVFLHDIVEAARAIREYASGKSLDEYRSDRQLRASIEREFITIGEALRRALELDPTIESRITATRQIIAFRINLVHGYDVIDDALVWSIVESDLAVLESEASDLLEETTHQ